MKEATTGLVWRALDARVAAAVVTLAGLALLASAMLLAQDNDARALTNCEVNGAEIPLNSVEAEFLTLINNYRAQNGKGPLTNLSTLNRASVWHSADMIAKGYFAHNEPSGRSWSQRMTDCGYPTGGYRGENIAAGFSTASSVFNAWKNSSGHNANMLNGNFTKIGIGKVGSYWNTDFGSVSDGGGGGTSGPTQPPPPTKTATPTRTPTVAQPTATKTATPTRTATRAATATKTPTQAAGGSSPAATKTSTSVPPTATKTATSVPPTATKTATAVPTSTGGIQITAGQNLVAWNGGDTAPRLVTQAQPIVKTIYGWDPVKKEWHLYDPDVPGYVNSLKTLKTGNAYWFLATGNAQLNID